MHNDRLEREKVSERLDLGGEIYVLGRERIGSMHSDQQRGLSERYTSIWYIFDRDMT